MKTFLLAAALLCAPNLLVAAQLETKADTRVVHVGDLDLTQPQDRAILDARIIAAARGVCRSGEARIHSDWGRCSAPPTFGTGKR